jgi:hypothetical protein
MRLLILCALALSLAGCWAGEGLYSNGDARQPIPAGIYRATSGEERSQIQKVSLLPNGLTEMGDGDGKGFYGFAPLDKENRRFVAWFRKEDDASSQDRTQLYLLLERRSADEFVFYVPICKGELAEIARRAGATIAQGTADMCVFPTRASLETAMRQVRITDDVMRMVRIRDK